MFWDSKLTDVEKINKYLKTNEFQEFKDVFDDIDIDSDEVFDILKKSIKQNKENYLNYLINDFNVNNMLKDYFGVYTIPLLDYSLEVNNVAFFNILKNTFNEQFTRYDTREFLEIVFNKYNNKFKTIYNLLNNKLSNQDISYFKSLENETKPDILKYNDLVNKLLSSIDKYFTLEDDYNGYWSKEFNNISVTIVKYSKNDKYITSDYSIDIKIGTIEYSIDRNKNSSKIKFEDKNLDLYDEKTELVLFNILQQSLISINNKINEKNKDYSNIIESIINDENKIIPNIKLEELENEIKSLKNINSNANDLEKKLTDKLTNSIKEVNKTISEQNHKIKSIKNDNQIEEFQNTIKKQSNEIKELQNKLLKKEDETQNLIDSFNKKLEKLEKKITNPKVVKSKLPLNVVMKKDSIKKDDGVIVKRESFDDF